MTIDEKLESLGYEKCEISDDPLTIRYVKDKGRLTDKSIVFQITKDLKNVTFIPQPKAEWLDWEAKIPAAISFEELLALADKAKELNGESISYD